MTAPIAWRAGGAATLVAHDGSVVVTVRSTRPFPPGAPVEGTLASGDGAMAFVLKVAGTRKVADDAWEIRGRLLSATTELLAAFARAASPA